MFQNSYLYCYIYQKKIKKTKEDDIMADVLSFGAVSFEAAQKIELLDKFEELYNDDGFAIFQSKKTYHSDDEAYKPFTYKLIIRARL